MAKEHDSCPDRERLGEQHDRQRGGQQPRRGEDRCGVKQHADRHEKQHGEGITHRQGLGGGAEAEVAAANDCAGEEGPQCHGDPKELGGANGDSQRNHEDGEREEFAGAGRGDVFEHPGDEASTCQEDDGNERGDLESRGAERHGHALQARLLPAQDGREGDQGRDREQVLHHHPAHGDVPGAGVEVAVVGEHADEHDRAGDGDGAAKHDSGGPVVSVKMRRGHAEQRGDTAGHKRAWDRHATHGQEFADVEVEPYSEEEQDDAHLGEFLGDRDVGGEAGRVRADGDAGEQVADNGRQPQLLCDKAEHERRGQAAGEREDEVDFMHGRVSWAGLDLRAWEV